MFLNNENTEKSSDTDHRIYVPLHDGWNAIVKANSTKECCYYKNPGEDHFHLLMTGEIHLVRGDEKCCLNCAARHGITTTNRLHWQQRDSFGQS